VILALLGAQGLVKGPAASFYLLQPLRGRAGGRGVESIGQVPERLMADGFAGEPD
jgi:hypothetical protein